MSLEPQSAHLRPTHGPVTAWIAIFIVSVLLAFVLGLVLGKPVRSLAAASRGFMSSSSAALFFGIETAPPSDVNLPADFKEFWDLWRLLKERYYKQPVDEKKMFYGALAGMTAALGDRYTAFFEPTIAQEFAQSLQGKFEGIGAEIGIKDDQLQIIAPLAGMPADKAGLRPGDIILSIDKQDTLGMSVDKAVSLIRGKKGTAVTLIIGRYRLEKDARGREKKLVVTQEISIVRDLILVKSVRVKYLRDGIARIDISHFNQDTTGLFVSAVQEVLSKDIKGLILDLRNNPGGYLDRANAIAGEWVGDQVVVVERQRGIIIDRYRGTGSGKLRAVPTVVLVNQGSASAAEIVAGALQDYGLAKIVGMKTFGKGSVQDYTEFPDKSAVKITIAEWLTPKERSIDGVGIQPDVQLERTPEDIHADRDPQLDKALEILSGKSAPVAKAAAAPKPGANRQARVKSSRNK